MFELIKPEQISEYEAFNRQHSKGHFLQSHLWSAVKPDWKWEAIAVRGGDGAIKGAMSVLIRRVPGLPFTLMYSARGPVCDVHDQDTLAQLTDGCAVLAKKYRAYALKLDPDIKSDDALFLQIMKDLGYRRKTVDKNFDGIQPNYVFRLDIKNKTEDQLLADFHQKTRYNLRLSYRKGVEVRLCGEEALDEFIRLMKENRRS